MDGILCFLKASQNDDEILPCSFVGMCRLEPEDLSKVRRRQSYEVHLESSAKKVSLSLSSLPSSRPPLSWTRSPSPITSPPSSRPLPPPPCSSHPSKPPPFAASRTIKCVLLKAPLLSWKSESQIIGRILWKSLSKSFLSHSLVIKLIQMNIQHLRHPGHPHLLDDDDDDDDDYQQ